MPSYKSKMEYLQNIYHRYHKAGKTDKGRILDEFCKVCDYNRKYAIRLLNGPYPEGKVKIIRKRKPVYSQTTIDILEHIWKHSGYLCGQRLKETIPLWMGYITKHFNINSQIKKELLNISARQIDNRLKVKKSILKRSIYRTTRPGYLLKHKIPIRTHNWDVRIPGFLEVDLVAHCGNSNNGQFIYTLNATDIQTGWTERFAVMGKGQSGVMAGIVNIRKNIPFRMRKIVSDNGEEFINEHLLNFCIKSRPRIQFTRSRPYKKDDNAHIEQKNFTHVRKIFGWDRYDTEEALSAMNDLYENELRLFQNLFQPSFKLIKKTRIGSKLVRKYDKPKTAFQRLLESGKFDKSKVKKLKEIFAILDPFELSKMIDEKLECIYKMAAEKININNGFKYPRSRILTSNETISSYRQPYKNSKSSWRNFIFSRKSFET
ncbi:MAG: integrase [Elusimicrobiota bacterium]